MHDLAYLIRSSRAFLTLAVGWLVLLFASSARAECAAGSYPCGADYCTPNGAVCCASAGHPEGYCNAGQTCTTDGKCSGGGGSSGGCPSGQTPCGSDYCTPAGAVCCASVGHPEGYCNAGQTCTASGQCQSSGGSGGSGGGVSCPSGMAATIANCGGDSCGCADACSTASDCKSGCCAGGWCSPPCACSGGSLSYCGSSGGGGPGSGSSADSSSGCAVAPAGPASEHGSAGWSIGLATLAAAFAFATRKGGHRMKIGSVLGATVVFGLVAIAASSCGGSGGTSDGSVGRNAASLTFDTKATLASPNIPATKAAVDRVGDVTPMQPSLHR